MLYNNNLQCVATQHLTLRSKNHTQITYKLHTNHNTSNSHCDLNTSTLWFNPISRFHDFTVSPFFLPLSTSLTLLSPRCSLRVALSTLLSTLHREDTVMAKCAVQSPAEALLIADTVRVYY